LDLLFDERRSRLLKIENVESFVARTRTRSIRVTSEARIIGITLVPRIVGIPRINRVPRIDGILLNEARIVPWIVRIEWTYSRGCQELRITRIVGIVGIDRSVGIGRTVLHGTCCSDVRR
jgi:hypothetical protein